MNNTLIKGLALIETLASSEQPMSLGELSESLGLVKSNVHRLMQALLELRYVSRDAGAYRPGIALLNLANAVNRNFDLRNVARPVMDKVLEQTRETVHLSILDGADVVYVEKLDSPEPVRAYSVVGGRAPAHCVATGKALLAFEEPEALAALGPRLKAHSPKTITTRPKLLAELRSIATNGYAINRGEWRETVRGVAAPIFDSSGRVVAALGISGPAERIKAAHYARYGQYLIEAADTITAALCGEHSGRRKMTSMLIQMKRLDPRSVVGPYRRARG